MFLSFKVAEIRNERRATPSNVLANVANGTEDTAHYKRDARSEQTNGETNHAGYEDHHTLTSATCPSKFS